MTMHTGKKCDREGGYVCALLANNCDGGVDRSRGMKFVEFSDMRTLKPSQALAVYRTGDKRKVATVFSFCPFCGASICIKDAQGFDKGFVPPYTLGSFPDRPEPTEEAQ